MSEGEIKMIDINELRRLAFAAANPTTKGRWIRLFGERTVYDRMEDGCRGIPIVATDYSPPAPREAAYLDFIAAADPATITEILDRLEAAESDALEQARLNGMGSEREAALLTKLEAAEKSDAESIAMYRKARDERDALRAKIEAMEQQEPVAEIGQQYTLLFVGSGSMTGLVKRHGIKIGAKLYLAPGAQPAPSEEARLVSYHPDGETCTLNINGVEMYYDRVDRDTQPTPIIPEGWLRAIDEALIVAHIGMANADDTYAQAKSKLDTLIGLHVDIATDPAVNGGWKLVPTAESRHPGIHKMLNALHAVDNTPGASEWESYAAFLAVAPEAKP